MSESYMWTRTQLDNESLAAVLEITTFASFSTSFPTQFLPSRDQNGICNTAPAHAHTIEGIDQSKAH